MIQAWIERIPKHIEKIVEFERGNEYKEGKVKVFLEKEKQVMQDSEGVVPGRELQSSRRVLS